MFNKKTQGDIDPTPPQALSVSPDYESPLEASDQKEESDSEDPNQISGGYTHKANTIVISPEPPPQVLLRMPADDASNHKNCCLLWNLHRKMHPNSKAAEATQPGLKQPLILTLDQTHRASPEESLEDLSKEGSCCPSIFIR